MQNRSFGSRACIVLKNTLKRKNENSETIPEFSQSILEDWVVFGAETLIFHTPLDTEGVCKINNK